MFAFSPSIPALSGNFVNNFRDHSGPTTPEPTPKRRYCPFEPPPPPSRNPFLESNISPSNFAVRSHRRVSNWFSVVSFPFFFPCRVSILSLRARLISIYAWARVCVRPNGMGGGRRQNSGKLKLMNSHPSRARASRSFLAFYVGSDGNPPGEQRGPRGDAVTTPGGRILPCASPEDPREVSSASPYTRQMPF